MKLQDAMNHILNIKVEFMAFHGFRWCIKESNVILQRILAHFIEEWIDKRLLK